MIKEIILEEVYKDGKYMGKIVTYEADLTPEFLDKVKKDKNDEMGWKKYHKVLKDKGFDIGEVE